MAVARKIWFPLLVWLGPLALLLFFSKYQKLIRISPSLPDRLQFQPPSVHFLLLLFLVSMVVVGWQLFRKKLLPWFLVLFWVTLFSFLSWDIGKQAFESNSSWNWFLLYFEVIRWDSLFLLSYALFCLMVLYAFPHARKRWMFVLGFVNFLCLVIAGMEHGFFSITGTVGDWLLLKYGLQNVSNQAARTLYIDQAKTKGFLLLLPFALILLPWFLAQFSITRRWLEKERLSSFVSEKMFQWVLPFLLFFLLLLPSPRSGGDLLSVSSNIFVQIGQEMWQDWRTPKQEEFQILLKGEVPFNTLQAKAIPTIHRKKKNVVFILLESQRSRSLTPYNPTLDTTPFLDSIAKQSYFVKEMHAVLPHTSKALVPILCGVYPKITQEVVEGETHGIPANCLPNLLKPLGYRSAFFQSATNYFEGRSRLVQNMGFHTLLGHEDMSNKGFAKTNYFGYEDRIMLKPSLKWIDQQGKKPLFLSYLLLVSHHTYTTPPSFPIKKYVESKDKEWNQYLNSLRYVDDFLKDLFAEFKKRGLYENTIFVFVGDHGEAFEEHGRRQHDNVMWDETLHVPSFVFDPSSQRKQTIVSGKRSQLDLLPTVMDLLGLTLKDAKIPGISLLQKAPAQRKTFHSCWYERQCMAMKEGSLKYIYHYDRRTWEVYDLDKDPMEKKDLVSGISAAKLKQVKKELFGWKNKINTYYKQVEIKRQQSFVSLEEPKTNVKLGVDFGDYVRLVGIQQKQKTIKAPATLHLSLVFKTLRKIPRGWKLFLHVHPKGSKTMQNEDHVPGMLPLHRWKKGSFVIDHHPIRISKNFAQKEGAIEIYIGFWKSKSGRLPVRCASKKCKVSKDNRYKILEMSVNP